jgi:hypothetical protein
MRVNPPREIGGEFQNAGVKELVLAGLAKVVALFIIHNRFHDVLEWNDVLFSNSPSCQPHFPVEVPWRTWYSNDEVV